MCDTIAVLASETRENKLLFGKNSDRSPNEPHLMIWEPAKKHSESRLRATYIEIEQVPETYACLLLKPSWTWGCEMGMNEHGLCIGNEAIFTKGAYGPDALTGMDICRLVLERCTGAREGVELIGSLLERWSQGGNCGFDHDFRYDNSFMLADEREAYVVDSCKSRWVAKKVSEFTAISNEPTLSNDYELGSAELLQTRIDFKKKITNRTITDFSGAQMRRFACLSGILTDRDGEIKRSIATMLMGSGAAKREKPRGVDVGTLMRVLSSHSEQNKLVEGVCMHYGAAIGDQTTGSFVAVPAERMVYVTGASLPCRSVYKPLSLRGELPVFSPQQEAEAAEYWRKRELVLRNLAAGRLDSKRYMDERERLAQRLLGLAEQMTAAEPEELGQLNRLSFELEQEFIDSFAASCTAELEKLTPKYASFFSKRRWQKKNAEFLKGFSAEG